MRRFGAILVALCFIIIQSALVIHTASAEALAPDHDRSDCAYCIGADRAGPAPASFEADLPAILYADEEIPAPEIALVGPAAAERPPTRGPPLL